MWFYLALRLGVLLARICPPARVHPSSFFIRGGALAGVLAGRLSPARGQVAANLRRIHEWNAAACPVRPAARDAGPSASWAGSAVTPEDVFASYGRYWAEFVSLTARPELLDRVPLRVEGEEHVLRAASAGPVCLVTGHIGNWDLAACWAARRLRPFAVLAEPLRPPALFRWFSVTRGASGMSVFPSRGGGLRLFRHLRGGGHAGLVVDRSLGGEGEAAPFLGSSRRFPDGAMRVARKAGAALLPVFLLRDEGGYVLRVFPELSRDVEPAAGFARVLEDMVAERPGQWCVLYPLHDVPASCLGQGEERCR